MALFSYACGIELDEKFVVTGGMFGQRKVAEYTEAGAVKPLPRLKTGRWAHACFKFVTDDGVTISPLFYLFLNTFDLNINKCHCFIGKDNHM